MKSAYLKYILALLLFGSNGIVASRIALTSYEIVLLRTLIGSALLIFIFIFSKQKINFLQYKRQFAFIAVSGIAMGASWMFLYEAYKLIGVSLASLAYYCGPVIVMVLSPLLFHEKLTWPKITGFLVVLCGVVLVNGGAIQDGKSILGLFYGGMSAVTLAVLVIFNKLAKPITGLENSVVQLFISFLTAAVYVGLRQGLTIQVSGEDWIPILLLGVLNTGVGCYLYFSSIGHLPVQTVAISGYLEPLSAVVFSVLFLGETMLPGQIAGAACILGGAVLGERRTVRKLGVRHRVSK